MSATNWEVLDLTELVGILLGLNFAGSAGHAYSLSLTVGCPEGLSERDNLPLARHTANHYGGWVKIVI